MEIAERIKSFKGDRRMMKAVIVFGAAGLLLIMLSALTDGGSDKKSTDKAVLSADLSSDAYCSETERRLEDFLRKIDGAGEVRAFVKVGSEQKYIYATEGKKSVSDKKTEEEEKYVLIGGSSGKEALVETVEAPEIEGAVILCSGCGDPAVREQVYRAAAAALGLPTAKIYVARLSSPGKAPASYQGG